MPADPRCRSWVAGAGAGAALLGLMALLGALFLVPILGDQARDAESAAAGRNLQRIWVAEQFWARANYGAYSEFAIAPGATTDEGWTRLQLELGEIRHSYEARVYGGVLWIVARGDLDGDASMDEWEVSSRDGEVRQVYDDVRDIYLHLLYYEQLGRDDRAPNAPLTLEEREKALAFRSNIAR